MNVLAGDISFFSLNNFDFLMLGIVGASTFFGLIRGLVKSLISATGWVVSMAVGMKFYFLLEPIVSKYITLGIVAAVIAGIVLFLITAIIIAIINNVFYIAFEAISGGLLDRSVGILFGLIRGCFLVSFVFYILLLMMPQLSTKDGPELKDLPSLSSAPVPNWAKKSKTTLLLNKGSAIIDDLMPLDFKRKLKATLSGGGATKQESRAILDMTQELSDSSDLGEEPIAMILEGLPREVLNKISQEDLLVLQDKVSEPKEKVMVLEEISKEYKAYMTNEEAAGLSQEALDEKNAEYYKLMSMIENQIIDYNIAQRQRDLKD
jgi:membrane protein required for colicin V production